MFKKIVAYPNGIIEEHLSNGLKIIYKKEELYIKPKKGNNVRDINRIHYSSHQYRNN